MYQFDVKFREVEQLSSLSIIQSLSCSEVCQVFVIRKYNGGMSWSLDVMSPFFQGLNDSKEFSVIYFIFPFGVCEHFWHECYRVLVAVWIQLSKYPSCCHFWCVWFNFGMVSTGQASIVLVLQWIIISKCQMLPDIQWSIQISCLSLSGRSGVKQDQSNEIWTFCKSFQILGKIVLVLLW